MAGEYTFSDKTECSDETVMTLSGVRPTVNGMSLAEPQAGPVPRKDSNIATRAASAGLAGVVLCLAAFSIFGAYTIQIQIARAQHE